MTTSARAFSVGLALVLAAACAAPVPSPSPTPSPSPVPAASATPGATLGAADLAARISEVEAQVPPIRGLEARGAVPNRILDAAGLRTALIRVVDASMTPEQFAAQSRFGARLGLLPAGTDLRQVQLDLLSEQVLGFYDRETKTMTIVQRGTDFGPLEKVTLAHEYTHALQDQHFDLASLGLEDTSNSDRALARLALVEGDATLLMTLWATEHLSLPELLTMTLQGLDPAQQQVLTTLPPILQRQLSFPYVDGLTFVNGLQGEGGWPAVDAVYAHPPDSTEQILHPEKYTANEEPVQVTAPDELGRLGTGWTASLSDTLGELSIEVWLEPTAGATLAKAAAAGWGGDRLTMYEGPNGAWLIVWSTAWDSPADALQFETAARAAVASDHASVAAGSKQVSVYLASDAAVLGRIDTTP
ncbi:MAG: hypothetical protein ACHQ15_02695 [Candidatus Limnocylindrales bacterium]